MRKIWAEQLGIGEHLTQKQWYWAMGLDDIPEPPTWPEEAWPKESWPQVRPFWYKNDVGARLDAWAKWDPLLLNELNFLRDSNASEYWKRHDPMLQYSGNPRNIQRREKQAEMSTRLTKSSKPVKTLADSLQSSSFLVISTGSIEKPSGVTSSPSHVSKQLKDSELTSVRPKRMWTLTTLGKELETERKTKQAKVNSRKQKGKE